MKLHPARLFLTICLLALLFPLAAQDTGSGSNPRNTEFFLTLGPVGILNTNTAGAPSPIKFAFGGGAAFSLPPEVLYLEPSIQFFSTYYLWNEKDGTALPAEIENRTALVPALLMDIPATVHLGRNSSVFTAGAGIAFLVRYSFLADGVPDSAADDIKKINKWFYSGLNFLYPSIQLGYIRRFEERGSAGVMLRAWLPLGSMLENRGIDGGMASIAFRLCFAASSRQHSQQEYAH